MSNLPVTINGRVISLPTGEVYLIRNNGQAEGLINQCMFISLLQYLKNNGHNLTLHNLRDIAGLDSSTEKQIFDINNEFHRNSLEKLSTVFNLTIVFIPISSDNIVQYNGEIIDVIGNGQNIVRICQFGTYHFQLLSEIPSNESTDNLSDDKKPLIWYNGKFYKLNDIDPTILETMLNIIDVQSNIKNLEYEESNMISRNRELYNQQKEYDIANTVLDTTIRKELFDFYQQELDKSNESLKKQSQLIKDKKEKKLELERTLELLKKK